MTGGKPKNRPGQEYKIMVYDNKTIDEQGSLDEHHSELEKACRKMAKDFRDKYRGRLNIQVIIR